jgi:hypothetical protein
MSSLHFSPWPSQLRLLLVISITITIITTTTIIITSATIIEVADGHRVTGPLKALFLR